MSYWWFDKLVSEKEYLEKYKKFLKNLQIFFIQTKQEELENLVRYWKDRNGLGDDKRLEIAESNLLYYKKKELEKDKNYL